MFVSHFWLFLYLGLMILSGIFVNGPYGLITTAVSANLVSCAFFIFDDIKLYFAKLSLKCLENHSKHLF